MKTEQGFISIKLSGVSDLKTISLCISHSESLCDINYQTDLYIKSFCKPLSMQDGLVFAQRSEGNEFESHPGPKSVLSQL